MNYRNEPSAGSDVCLNATLMFLVILRNETVKDYRSLTEEKYRGRYEDI